MPYEQRNRLETKVAKELKRTLMKEKPGFARPFAKENKRDRRHIQRVAKRLEGLILKDRYAIDKEGSRKLDDVNQTL